MRSCDSERTSLLLSLSHGAEEDGRAEPATSSSNGNGGDGMPTTSRKHRAARLLIRRQRLFPLVVTVLLVVGSLSLLLRQLPHQLSDTDLTGDESLSLSRLAQYTKNFPLLGKKHKKEKHHKKKKDHHDNHNNAFVENWKPPEVVKRCNWVMARFHERDQMIPPLDLKKRYLAQSKDPNVFYRATAHLFWPDFALGKWGHDFTNGLLLKRDPDDDSSSSSDSSDSSDGNNKHKKDDDMSDDADEYIHVDGARLTKKSVWTWVTGDQHLSNFGAWQNRHKDVVFGVNDFDEAAIFDFQIDVLRIAVSICSHAITNKLNEKQVNEALKQFTHTYVKTIVDYVDNQEALLFELTPKTASGKLQDFLEKTRDKKSTQKQMVKFTHKNATTGQRHFIKGSTHVPHPDTSLAKVPAPMEALIRDAFTANHYGASMMKLGWAVQSWDDDFFTVLDVAERVGSGIGSFGVDRYYVLLKGKDGLLQRDGEGTAVILDVKFQPKSAVSRVLNSEDAAWYSRMFQTEAARVVEAQRRLTSYTDPFTGWITLKNLDPNDKNTTYGQDQPFSVRQRSPWKDSPDLDDLKDPDDFYEFVSQIAVSTATSHVRGSVAKPPGDFKNVIATVLGPKHKRKEWGKVVAKSARAYREQVLLDFECFQQFVQDYYGLEDDTHSDGKDHSSGDRSKKHNIDDDDST